MAVGDFSGLMRQLALLQQQNRRGPVVAASQLGQGISQGAGAIADQLRLLQQNQRQDQLIQQNQQFTRDRDKSRDDAGALRDARQEADALGRLGLQVGARKDAAKLKAAQDAAQFEKEFGLKQKGEARRAASDVTDTEIRKSNAATASSRAEIAKGELARKTARDKRLAANAEKAAKLRERQIAVNETAQRNLSTATDERSREAARKRVEGLLKTYEGQLEGIDKQLTTLAGKESLGLDTRLQDQIDFLRNRRINVEADVLAMRLALFEAVGKTMRDLIPGNREKK